MHTPYFYENFEQTDGLTLSAANIHYLLNVLRMRDGEQIGIVNGKGSIVDARLRVSGKRSADIELINSRGEQQASYGLHIAIAFTKNASRMEWFIEKATEIGVRTITPVLTQRSEKLFFKKERFEKILIAAMLQSHQSHLPLLHSPMLINDLLLADEEQKFIAYCGDGFPKPLLRDVLKPDKATLILIGPEGDFTPDEVHLCREHHFETVALGENRLRTETAGIYACTLFNIMQ